MFDAVQISDEIKQKRRGIKINPTPGSLIRSGARGDAALSPRRFDQPEAPWFGAPNVVLIAPSSFPKKSSEPSNGLNATSIAGRIAAPMGNASFPSCGTPGYAQVCRKKCNPSYRPLRLDKHESQPEYPANGVEIAGVQACFLIAKSPLCQERAMPEAVPREGVNLRLFPA